MMKHERLEGPPGQCLTRLAKPAHHLSWTRLLHHSTTVNIRGESYRLKEHRLAGLIGGREQQVEQATAAALTSAYAHNR